MEPGEARGLLTAIRIVGRVSLVYAAGFLTAGSIWQDATVPMAAVWGYWAAVLGILTWIFIEALDG